MIKKSFSGADWFCYHVNSPCIFPVGFCEQNNIPLVPPNGYNRGTFNWQNYLRLTNNVAVSSDLFNPYVPIHGFIKGMKMEATDLMDPRLICVATVARIVGRLLKIHFDGWEDEYDQWLDCESSDIYPVGWCQSMGHKLEGPKCQTANITKSPKAPKKRGRKKKIKDSPPKVGNIRSIKVEPLPSQIKSETEEEKPAETSMNEPEAGQEPSGPEQSMPVASDPQPPAERKATSYINVIILV